MKILQINTVCGSGSTGRIATDLYDVLEKAGHECCIAYGRGNAPEKYNTIKIGTDFDIYMHVAKTRLFDLHGYGSKRATKKLIKEIDAYKPDIIHLHNIHGYYLNIKVLFEYLSTLPTPIVWILHDAWSISGHSAHFDLNDDGSIPKKNKNRLQYKEYPKSLFFDNSKKNYLFKEIYFSSLKNLTIVTPSEWLKKIIEKSFLSKFKTKLIHNGIDLNQFKPTKTDFREKNGFDNKIILLGVASVWTEKKGIEYFNKLAESLDERFQIILVGVNKKDTRKINSKIFCVNRTENIKSLAAIYSAANLFLNPTLEDNFPTTNIESLACGTPVITFDTGGSSESLNSKTGKIIPKGDFQQLYNEVINFNYNKDYSKACIERSKKFDKKNIYNEYIKLYHEVIK